MLILSGGSGGAYQHYFDSDGNLHNYSVGGELGQTAPLLSVGGGAFAASKVALQVAARLGSRYVALSAGAVSMAEGVLLAGLPTMTRAAVISWTANDIGWTLGFGLN